MHQKIHLRPGSFLCAAAMALLPACSTTPVHAPEPVIAPDHWAQTTATALPSTISWWKTFQDPVLDDLIAQALTANYDIRIAATHLAAAQAIIKATQADTKPVLEFVVGQAGVRDPSSQLITEQDDYIVRSRRQATAAFQAGYEIDLWGRLKKGIEATKLNRQASADDLQAAKLAIIHAVTMAYAEARFSQTTLTNVTKQADLAKQFLQNEQKRFQAGLTNQEAVNEAIASQAQLMLASTHAENTARRACNKLALLLGKAPAEFSLPPDSQQRLFSASLQILPDLPASVIARRPDVNAAWNQLKVATGQIELTQLERFPKLDITGQYGYISHSLSQFGGGGGLRWLIGVNSLLPIYDGGRIQSRVDQAVIARDEKNLLYRKTVYSALQEVESALIDLQEKSTEMAYTQQLLDNSRQLARNHQREFSVGRIGQQVLLRTALDNQLLEDKFLAAQYENLLAFISVHYVLASE